MYNIPSEAVEGNEQKGSVAKFNEKAYLNVMPEGNEELELIIRLLPITETGSPFLEVIGHDLDVVPSPNFSTRKNKTFMCPTNEGGEGKCPICEANRYYYSLADEAEKLMKDAISRGDNETASAQKMKFEQYKDVAKHYGKRTYFFVRCIQRGKESEGVKFWRFPKSTKGDGIYDKIMAVYNRQKKKNGENIFDLVLGYDLYIYIKREADNSGKFKRVFNVQLDDKKPLGTEEQIISWCEDTTKWSDLYPMKSYEYLRCVLKSGGRAPIWNKENKCYIPNMEGVSIPQETPTPTQTVTSTPTPSAKQAPSVAPHPSTSPTTSNEADSDLPF